MSSCPHADTCKHHCAMLALEPTVAVVAGTDAQPHDVHVTHAAHAVVTAGRCLLLLADGDEEDITWETFTAIQVKETRSEEPTRHNIKRPACYEEDAAGGGAGTACTEIATRPQSRTESDALAIADRQSARLLARCAEEDAAPAAVPAAAPARAWSPATEPATWQPAAVHSQPAAAAAASQPAAVAEQPSPARASAEKENTAAAAARRAPVKSGLEEADAFAAPAPKRQKRAAGGGGGLQNRGPKERVDDSLRIMMPPNSNEPQPMDAEVLFQVPHVTTAHVQGACLRSARSDSSMQSHQYACCLQGAGRLAPCDTAIPKQALLTAGTNTPAGRRRLQDAHARPGGPPAPRHCDQLHVPRPLHSESAPWSAPLLVVCGILPEELHQTELTWV